MSKKSLNPTGCISVLYFMIVAFSEEETKAGGATGLSEAESTEVGGIKLYMTFQIFIRHVFLFIFLF